MTRFTPMAMLLMAAALALPSGRADEYLGKNAAQWELQLRTSFEAKAKRNAAFALGKLGTDSWTAVPALAECLSNKDVDLRETAACSLGQIVGRGQSDGDLLKRLCRLLGDDADPRVRRSAAVTLGRLGPDDEMVRRALEKAIGDGDPGVRQNAAWALGEVCERTSNVPVDSLRKALQDGDKLVMRDAAGALGKIVNYQGPADDGEDGGRSAKIRKQCEPAIKDLVACVSNDYLELRKSACATLINLVTAANAEAAAALAKACNDEDIEVRRNAALALANIGGPGSRPAIRVLLDALKSPDVELRKMAAIAFRKIGGDAESAIADLVRAMAKDSDHRVRYNIAIALGGFKERGQGAIAGLVSRVVDPKEEDDVRVAAAISMQSIGAGPAAEQAMGKLIKVLDDTTQPARVRERTLWPLRVHGRSTLAGSEEFLSALKKILTEKGLNTADRPGKMLRYDSAFLLGAVQGERVPEEVFPVLLDFLKDSSIRILTGIDVKNNTGGVRENVTQGGSSKVVEEGTEDGRLMAIRALKAIGPHRVRDHSEIVRQLQQLREDPAAEQKLKDETKDLLKELGIK